MRPPSPTTMLTLSRTSGRMSATRRPSGRMICTACHTPRERGRDLAHARVLGAGIGVDLGQELGLGREIDRRQRIEVGVELAVGARRRRRHGAADGRSRTARTVAAGAADRRPRTAPRHGHSPRPRRPAARRPKPWRWSKEALLIRPSSKRQRSPTGSIPGTARRRPCRRAPRRRCVSTRARSMPVRVKNRSSVRARSAMRLLWLDPSCHETRDGVPGPRPHSARNRRRRMAPWFMRHKVAMLRLASPPGGRYLERCRERIRSCRHAGPGEGVRSDDGPTRFPGVMGLGRVLGAVAQIGVAVALRVAAAAGLAARGFRRAAA